MVKAVGRVTLPEERLDRLRALLLLRYQGYRGFLRDWLHILCHYERLLQALQRQRPRLEPDGPEQAWQALEAAVADWPVLTRVGARRSSRHRHLRRYRGEINGLCDRWGLRCDWAPAWVHEACFEWANRAVSPEEITEDAAVLGLFERAGAKAGTTGERDFRCRRRLNQAPALAQ